MHQAAKSFVKRKGNRKGASSSHESEKAAAATLSPRKATEEEGGKTEAGVGIKMAPPLRQPFGAIKTEKL